MLASVCAMALLANLLANTFAGLYFQKIVPVTTTVIRFPPYESAFQTISGSSGPPVNQRPTESLAEPSGAWHGGTGEDQFLIADSDYTRNTTLPPWTDGRAMYIPFMVADEIRSGQLWAGEVRQSSALSVVARSTTFQAHTIYLSARSNCSPMTFAEDYTLQ